MRALHTLSVGLVAVAVAALALLVLREPAPVNAAANDSIEGKVVLEGKVPARNALDMSSDPVCAAKNKGATDETVVVGKAGALKDVHVSIESGQAGEHEAPNTPVVIEQVGCIYRPRISGAMRGQEVQIVNGDKTLHNVHAYRAKRTAFNRAQPSGAKPIAFKKLGKAGTVFTLKCDVHTWMAAYVPITDHPFFDVTGADGSFSIKDVPRGKSYTLEAWHPKYGLKSMKVKSGDANVKIAFP